VEQTTGRGEPPPELPAHFSHPLGRARGESSMFVINPQTSECLHYESITGYPSTKVAEIPREILTEHTEVEIRNDLIDCAIDVCSVEVCPLVMSMLFCTKKAQETRRRFPRFSKTISTILISDVTSFAVS
jgi:hypothetical protein